MTAPDNAPGFQFYSGTVDDLLAQPRGDAYLAFVPTPVSHRTELFKILKHELRLPDYFGSNWDALEECLNDLRWLNGFRVIKLVHAGLPLKPPSQFLMSLKTSAFSGSFKMQICLCPTPVILKGNA